MKVIFLPDYSKNNPYQKALANSLSKEDVDIKFSSAFNLLSVLRVVKNYKPDILHIHWAHPFLLASSRGKTILKSVSFIGGLLILKLFGVKIVWTVHNIVNHEGRFSSLELFFNKFVARLCDKIIVHCPSAKNEVMNAYAVTRDSVIVVIPHGNYIHSYENVIDKAQARKQLHLGTEDVIFLYFGLIEPYKRVPELIEAFKKLKAPQAKLLIVGKPYNIEIADGIMERCDRNNHIEIIFKFIPDNEIQIYMNAADVVVLPYQDILTSGSVILAMSFGKPIIAPAIGCIPDTMDSEGSFLYNPSDENGLLEALRRALDLDLVNMGSHNLEVAKQINWDEITKQTYEIYQECLASGRQSVKDHAI
jgi:beta-1,4-mannosyltransferase